MDYDQAIRDLAAQQFGVMSKGQLISAGLSDKAIQHRTEKAMIEHIRPSVFRLTGTAGTWEQRVMAMCLWAAPGSVASHRTAAALWRLPNYDPGPLDLSTVRHITASDVNVYKVKELWPPDVSTVGPIPVTSIGRTMVDLAAISPQRLVEDATDEVLRRGLCSLEDLWGALRRASRARRNGTSMLRRVLEQTDDRVGATQSTLESRLLRCLLKAGLPRPVPQYEIRHNGEFLARVDFAYPAQRIAIEAQSYQWHGGPNAQTRDEDRFTRLREIDWEVVLVTWSQASYKPNEVAARVRHHLLTRTDSLPL